MQEKQRVWRWVGGVIAVVIMTAGGSVSTALANNATSSSPNYKVIETEFGSTSMLESCSGHYCTRASIGSMTGAVVSSPKTTAVFGEIAADSDPLLEMSVASGASNLGVFRTDQPATKVTVIEVRTHLSSGYTLHIMGNPPEYAGHTFATTQEPAPSVPGTEFFGINVVQNTSPSVGADTQQIPSPDVSFGMPTARYSQPNLFMYKSGDVIAQSETESGRTKYTVSMVMNVSNATPAGHFTSDFSAVAIPLF